VTSCPATYPAASRANATLAVIMIVAFTAMLDRYLIGLLLEPIRHDMALSDTEISLLQGAAFAILFAVSGIPFGRLVDRWNRRNILLAGLVLWSALTIACGLAPGYPELFAARLGVGLGEACLAPAAASLLIDTFRPERHGRALALYTTAAVLGGGGSFILGAQALRLANHLHAEGIVDFLEPWRLTFLIVGFPGLLAGLGLLFVREPARKGVGAATPASLGDLFRFLRRNMRVLGLMVAANCFCAVTGTGVTAWMAAFFERTWRIPPTTSGLWIGLCLIGSVLIGGPLSGMVADRSRLARATGGKLNVVALGCFLTVPFAALFPEARSLPLAIVLYVLFGTAFNFMTCTFPAALQDLLPGNLRGQVFAIHMMIVALVGYAGGATAIALVTEHVFGDPLLLRHSLALVGCVTMALGGILLLMARSSYQAALAGAYDPS